MDESARILAPVLEAGEIAQTARPTYVRDTQPGIRRQRRSDRFSYIAPDGSVLTDARAVARIQALAVPPAYEDVWICTNPRGHLQATGRDARGRKQYRYHAEWRRVRDGA